MFDCHCHLTDPRLFPHLPEVCAAAKAADITGLCSCGTSPADWEAVAALAERKDLPFRVIPAFGVHPWFCESLPEGWLATLEGFLARFPGAPVGEIGLDRMKGEVSEAQRRVLAAQLDLAARLGRSVVLHGAKAWGQVIAEVEPFAPRLKGFLCHGFSRVPGLIGKVAKLGGYCSIGGGACNYRAVNFHAFIKLIPADCLLIETDSPDMFPEGGAGVAVELAAAAPEPPPNSVAALLHLKLAAPKAKPLNQPSNLPFIAHAIAGIRGVSTAELTTVCEANAARFFAARTR